MRLLRVLAVASAAALLAQPSAAQEGRQFKDAWFWGGARADALVYSSNYNTDNAVAPLVGIDWMITRTYGGLYVSFDQSFFSPAGFLKSASSACRSGVVNLNNLQSASRRHRRLPDAEPSLHPYVGLGLGINRIGSVGLDDAVRQRGAARTRRGQRAEQARAFAPFVMLGAQQRLPMLLRVRARNRHLPAQRLPPPQSRGRSSGSSTRWKRGSGTTWGSRSIASA